VWTARVGNRGLAAEQTAWVSSLATDMDAHECRAELDSHADTTVIGDTMVLIIQDFDCPVRVHGYNESVVQRESCATVTGILAYDNPVSGITCNLIFHQAILIPCMKSSLISLMQLCDLDLYMNDEPKSMALTLMDDHHCINPGMTIHWSTTDHIADPWCNIIFRHVEANDGGV
jgi:hypothetical protein